MIQNGQAYILVPTAIAPGQLTSSTIPDPDTGEVAWNPATAYSVGQRAYLASNRTIYERLVAGTTATSPLTDTANWAPAGRQNRWAMFDNSAGTVSSGTSPLTVVLKPGQVGGLFADGLVGRQLTVTAKSAAGGTVVYSRTVDLDNTAITSVYEWFFTDFEQKSSVVLVDLPSQYFDPEVAVSVSGTGTVKCETLRVGPLFNIGGTLMGAAVSVINFSRITTDDYGVTNIVPRGFLKQLRATVLTDRANFKRIFRLLTQLKDTPAVYIACLVDDFAPLNVQGIPDDWSIDVTYSTAVQCNLQIKGISQ